MPAAPSTWTAVRTRTSASTAMSRRTARPSSDAGRRAHSGIRCPIGCEVLPDLLDDARFDRQDVFLGPLLLRIEQELDGPALRSDRARIEDVETFVDRVGLRDTPFQL